MYFIGKLKMNEIKLIIFTIISFIPTNAHFYTLKKH